MLKSSESIAALAAALARAQQELTNPEKSLTATLPAASAREEARTYRYASLATGLDIVRKSLGRQEIAAVQSTAIDQQTGLVRLVTVLAHSSGEWLSSEWPVCPITETANPQRMGAALTYARRYALFTLVGIAGEDDLDAPEPSRPTAASTNGRSSAPEAAPISAQRRPMPARSQTNGSRPPPAQHDQILPPEDSQALREALFAELALIQSTDGLTRWAHRRLRSKNILQDADAHTVEKAFQAKIDAASESATAAANELEPAAVANDPHAPNSPSGEQRIEAQPPPQADASGNTPPPQHGTTDAPAARRRAARKNRQRGGEEPQPNASASASGAEASNANGDVPALQGSSLGKPAPPPVGSDLSRSEGLPASVGHVDKSVLHLDEPRRLRDKEHLRYVASQPCLLCSLRPSDAHHIRFAQPRALGRKVSDEYAVPLCRSHHRDVHDSGNEAAWWHDIGIDPIEIAHQLWRETCAQRIAGESTSRTSEPLSDAPPVQPPPVAPSLARD